MTTPPYAPQEVVDSGARVGVAEVRTELHSHQDMCVILGAQTRDAVTALESKINTLEGKIDGMRNILIGVGASLIAVLLTVIGYLINYILHMPRP